MGILHDVTKSYINIATKDKRIFAVALLPASTSVLWFENDRCTYNSPVGDSVSDYQSFDISPWLGSFCNRWSIGKTTPDWKPMQYSGITMTREYYIDAVSHIIENCKRRKGKTVFSRTISGLFDPGDSQLGWGDIADRFFTHFPDTFRYIFYSPYTGGWIGATPELLLDFDRKTGLFHTVAFAGTRRKILTSNMKWDNKNLQENRFVSEYIQSQLYSIGIEANKTPLRTVTYGDIEHLCSDIYGSAPQYKLGEIIDCINPTPALCGFPKSEALADLAKYEPHKRHCYGGFIGIDTPDRYMAFVNLRCLHFDNNRYCIYGGGGIVSESEPKTEYDETIAKTSFLCELLK